MLQTVTLTSATSTLKDDNPVLGNKNFRLALNYALNRNDYNKLANADTYTAFNGLVFPGLQAKGTTYGEAYDLNSYSYPLDGDQDKATEYLNAAMQELGIANASDITVEVVTTDADSSKRIVDLSGAGRMHGINVKIRQVTYADIYGKVFPEHDYEIGYGGWGSDLVTSTAGFELFKGDSSYNYSQYENPEVDQLLTASQDEPDTDKRMDELNQVEQDIRC